MAFRGVGGGFLTGTQAVVDVPPMVRRNIRRIDAKRVHGIIEDHPSLEVTLVTNRVYSLTKLTNPSAIVRIDATATGV